MAVSMQLRVRACLQWRCRCLPAVLPACKACCMVNGGGQVEAYWERIAMIGASGWLAAGIPGEQQAERRTRRRTASQPQAPAGLTPEQAQQQTPQHASQSAGAAADAQAPDPLAVGRVAREEEVSSHSLGSFPMMLLLLLRLHGMRDGHAV